jgi:hypothetical protein
MNRICIEYWAFTRWGGGQLWSAQALRPPLVPLCAPVSLQESHVLSARAGTSVRLRPYEYLLAPPQQSWRFPFCAQPELGTDEACGRRNPPSVHISCIWHYPRGPWSQSALTSYQSALFPVQGQWVSRKLDSFSEGASMKSFDCLMPAVMTQHS